MNRQCEECPLKVNTVNGAWCAKNRISVEYSNKEISCNMDAKQFFIAVRKMRELQKEYFKNRDREVLKKSKVQESIIDEEIARVENLVGAEALKEK